MAQPTYLALVQAFEKLFISSKQKRIEQQEDGSYYVRHNGLGTEHLVEHLKGNQTVGIFSGEIYSKYLCFDVDTGKHNRGVARNDVRVLMYALLSEFDIPINYINVVDSGNKGYHVYLFFDDVIRVDYLKAFYHEVLERTGYDPSEIEFRPTNNQGVKLPLGIHKVTGNRCNFVDPRTQRFQKLPNNYIHEVKQLDTAEFKAKNNLKDLHEIQEEKMYLQLAKFLDDKEARTFSSVCQSLDFTEYQLEHAETDIIQMLKDKTLIYPNSRNKYTFVIAIFLKGQGHEPQDVERMINEIMLNSKRNYNNLVDSSEKHIERETKKITRYVFKTNISIGTGNKSVALYKSEIKDILALKNLTLMKLYLSLMVHAKRHQPIGADSFYMAYSVMANYGNAKDRSKLRKHIGKLEQLGRVEVVASGKIDPIRSEVKGNAYYKPNVYRIKKSFNQTSEQKVIVKAQTSVDVMDLLKTAYHDNVISFSDIKSNLARNTFIEFKQSL